MRKATVEGIVGIALLVIAGFGLPWLYSEPELHETLIYCQSEDEVPVYEPCFWDAERSGNGKGESFIAYPNGTVEYIDN